MTDRLIFGGWDDAAALHICRHMRRDDEREVYATRTDMDAWAYYRDLGQSVAAHLVFEIAWPADGGLPVCLAGVAQITPGVGVAHLVGTDDMTPRHAVQIAHRVRRRWIPQLLEAGLHRVQADTLQDYPRSHAFLAACGARPEGVREAIGKSGESFTTFVWLKKEMPNVLEA